MIQVNIIFKPKGRKILAVAPHPDDEVLGCGGTLRKHVLAGDNVQVLYLTDGGAGRKFNESPEVVIQSRKKEAREAAKCLGIHQLFWMNEPDGGLAVNPHTLEAIHEILYAVQPDVLYIPHSQDAHPDHRNAYQLVQDAVCTLKIPRPALYAYEIWEPLYADYLINITEVMAKKRQALHCYRSQLELHEYEQMIEALNTYRILRIADRRLLFPAMKRERREWERLGLASVWPWRYAEAFQKVDI